MNCTFDKKDAITKRSDSCDNPTRIIAVPSVNEEPTEYSVPFYVIGPGRSDITSPAVDWARPMYAAHCHGERHAKPIESSSEPEPAAGYRRETGKALARASRRWAAVAAVAVARVVSLGNGQGPPAGRNGLAGRRGSPGGGGSPQATVTSNSSGPGGNGNFKFVEPRRQLLPRACTQCYRTLATASKSLLETPGVAVSDDSLASYPNLRITGNIDKFNLTVTRESYLCM